MQVFGRASGQQLNPAKSRAMLLGSRTLQVGAPQLPLRLVRSAEVLGLTFHEGVGPPTVDWQAQTAAVLHRFQQLAALPLSALGRGLGSAAWAARLMESAASSSMQSMLACRQLWKLPRSPRQLSHLLTLASRLGGRGPRFRGVAAPLLLGSPRVGGSGMLPVTEHIRARHAVWGARLACALAQPLPPLWAVAARGALGPFSHLCHPLALLAWRPSPVECASLPAPLLRLCDGLASLPPIADVSDEPLGLGPWCDTAPLWHNPLLPAAERAVLAAEFLDLAGTGITTVGELASAAAAISEAVGRAEFLYALAVHLPHHTATFADHSCIRSRLHNCVGRLPPSWLVAALAGGPPPAIAFAALALPRLGWRFPDGPVQLQALSVRTATWAQLQRVGDQRQHRHARSVSHVFAASNRPAPLVEKAQAAIFRLLLSQLWRLPWHNQHKEVFWRLTLDALPTAARLHNAQSACICGAPVPDWLHHFWLCPVAVGLLAVLTERLQSGDMLPVPLLPLHVLLAQPPSSRLHAGVWRVVCLAFVCALDHVRRAACAIALAGVPPVAQSAQDPSVPFMINRAVARFWDLLTEFCMLNAAPDSWQRSVDASHPFLAWSHSWVVLRA